MQSNSNEDTDKKLAAWLKKILPAVEKELVEGLTPVYGDRSDSSAIPIKIEEYQDINLGQFFTSATKGELNKGAATWLSVSTQDSPVLALSCSSKTGEQKSSFLFVFEPRRSKTDAKIYWHELVSIPVKEAIEILATNPENRDMFAGTSTAGDLYIWNYHNKASTENESQVTELFSKASEDSIVAMTFLSDNRLLCCQSDGRIFVYKVNKKQTTIDKIMKIEPRNVKEPLITSITLIPKADDDFLLGMFNGGLIYCSTNQLMPQDAPFNPIVRELQSHKFTISSLRPCQHKGKVYIVSGDLSGEVYFHEVEDTFMKPKLVVKLPLPMKHKIAITNSMEHLFFPLEKGSLEVFKTSSNVRESIIEGKLHGAGNVIELSRNE